MTSSDSIADREPSVCEGLEALGVVRVVSKFFCTLRRSEPGASILVRSVPVSVAVGGRDSGVSDGHALTGTSAQREARGTAHEHEPCLKVSGGLLSLLAGRFLALRKVCGGREAQHVRELTASKAVRQRSVHVNDDRLCFAAITAANEDTGTYCGRLSQRPRVDVRRSIRTRQVAERSEDHTDKTRLCATEERLPEGHAAELTEASA